MCFLFVSNMLELLQAIRKTSILCITSWWINCKILYHLTIVLSCSQNYFQHVGVQLVIDEMMNNYKTLFIFIFIFFRHVGIIANDSYNIYIVLSIRRELVTLFPTCWSITNHPTCWSLTNTY